MPVEVVPLAVPPKKDEKPAETSQRTSFGTFDSVAAEEKKPGNKFMIVGVVAVLLVAAAATFAFLKMQKPGPTPQHAQEAASVPPTTSQSAAANGSVTPASPNVNAAAVPNKPAAESETKKPAAKNNDKSSNTEKPAPAEKPVAVATLASNGPSRIAQSSATQTPDVAPTSFTVESGSAPNLSALARPVNSSTPAASIEQSQLEPLQLIRAVSPVYPPIAKARNMTGTVEVEVKVGKDGKPSSPKFISGSPIFKDAAFDAVMQYKFKPAKLNGEPIEQLTRVKLVFK
jgi:TonB family protein